MRICSQCRLPKDDYQFSWRNKAHNKRNSTCKPCKAAYNKVWYRQNAAPGAGSERRNQGPLGYDRLGQFPLKEQDGVQLPGGLQRDCGFEPARATYAAVTLMARVAGLSNRPSRVQFPPAVRYGTGGDTGWRSSVPRWAHNPETSVQI
jgi:hypothetical protein